MTWSEQTHPEDLQADLNQFERMLNGDIDAYSLEKRYIRKDASLVYANFSIACVRLTDGSVDYVQALIEDVTERKRLEAEKQQHLHFFESMDRVNRALHSSNDLETAMNRVLEILLEIFDCDRAYLVYPCDPEAETWHVPYERTVPEYPGVHALKVAMPMDEQVAASFRAMLNSDSSLTFGLGNPHPLPEEVCKQFHILSHMAAALRPKGDSPWQFGLHQCSRDRIWSRPCKNVEKMKYPAGID